MEKQNAKPEKENTTSDIALRIFQKFDRLSALKANNPNLKFAGEISDTPNGKRSLNLENQLTITLEKNGQINIIPSKLEGKDVFMPGKEFQITLDPKTQNTKPSLSPQARNFLKTVLELVDGYYSIYEQSAQLAIKYHNISAKQLSSFFPKFPFFPLRELTYRIIDSLSTVSLTDELLSAGLPTDILRQILNAGTEITGLRIDNVKREDRRPLYSTHGRVEKPDLERVNLFRKCEADASTPNFSVHYVASLSLDMPLNDPTEPVRKTAKYTAYVIPRQKVDLGFNCAFVIHDEYDNENLHWNKIVLDISQADPENVVEIHGDDTTLYNNFIKNKKDYDNIVKFTQTRSIGGITITHDGRVQSTGGYKDILDANERMHLPIDTSRDDDAQSLLDLLKAIVDPFKTVVTSDFAKEEERQRYQAPKQIK